MSDSVVRWRPAVAAAVLLARVCAMREAARVALRESMVATWWRLGAQAAVLSRSLALACSLSLPLCLSYYVLLGLGWAGMDPEIEA
mmetsp:Transcript_13438/g.34192  ORF Transcript_13438/g.34192 Transcript_13438/m.34192 type:complete len:86 (+) Transcript_13438:843-1100(+)